MGEFDKPIKRLTDAIAILKEMVSDMDTGWKIEIDGEDVTTKWRDNACRDIERYEKLISAYETRDANRT